MCHIRPAYHGAVDGWFCRAMREETYQNSKDAMLDYSISLLDDANDFFQRPAMQCCFVV